MAGEILMFKNEKCLRCGEIIGNKPHYRAGKDRYAHSGVCPGVVVNSNCSLCGKPVNGFAYRQDRNGAVYHFDCNNPKTNREIRGVGKKPEYVKDMEKNICTVCGQNIIFGQQFSNIGGQCVHFGDCKTSRLPKKN